MTYRPGVGLPVEGCELGSHQFTTLPDGTERPISPEFHAKLHAPEPTNYELFRQRIDNLLGRSTA